MSLITRRQFAGKTAAGIAAATLLHRHAVAKETAAGPAIVNGAKARLRGSFFDLCIRTFGTPPIGPTTAAFGRRRTGGR